MTRPPFEVADVIRTAGNRFGEHNSLTWPQCKVLEAIARCRTAALGGHRDQCSNCGHQASPTTPVGTGTVLSARPTLATSGSPSASRNCCPWATIIWSSACRTHWCR